MNRKLAAFLLSLLLLTAVFSAAYAENASIEVDVTFGQTEARNMLSMINDFRTGADAWYWNSDDSTKTVCTGLLPLVYDYDLEAAAMQRAAEISVYFSHTRPNGSDCDTAFPSDWLACGENIAAGQQTAQAAYMSWREDDYGYSGQGHRRNMLNNGFNCIGIGHVVRNGVHYWTHALAYRSSPNTSATAVSNGDSAVPVSVAYDRVTGVYGEDATLEIGHNMNYPAVTFVMDRTWPQSSRILYMPYDGSLEPAWTASDPAKISMEEISLTALHAGEVTLTATVFGKTVTSVITIQPKSIAGAQITVDAAGLLYTGSAQTPVVTVKDGDRVLVKGSDYTVAYADNIKASDTASVTVTGLGDYTGSVSQPFSIWKVPLTIAAKDKTITYGDAPANDGVVYTGFVGGESASVLGGALAWEYDYERYGDVGTYCMAPSGLTSDNYEISFTAGTLTVVQKEAGLRWNETLLTYTGDEQAPTAEVTGAVNSDVLEATVTGAQTDAGTYTAEVTDLTGSKAHNYRLPADVTAEFVIQKAVPVVTAPVGNTGLLYTGDPQPLVTGGSTTGGILKYSLEKAGEYTEEIPTAVEAGTYSVWYRVDGDNNYEDVAPASVKAVISKKAVSEVTVDGGVYALNEKTATFKKAKSKTAKALTIAATVEANGKKYKVTAIADNACKGMSKLTKVTIGKNVSKIGKNAFSGCKALKTVSGGAAVTTIGESAFASCVKLTSVPAFSNLTTIGAGAFKTCKALPKFTFAAKVKNIGKNAFAGCVKLKTIVIKTKLLKDKTVGASAFKGIYSKPTVTCPKGMAKTYKKLLQKKGMPKKAVFK